MLFNIFKMMKYLEKVNNEFCKNKYLAVVAAIHKIFKFTNYILTYNYIK